MSDEPEEAPKENLFRQIKYRIIALLAASGGQPSVEEAEEGFHRIPIIIVLLYPNESIEILPIFYDAEGGSLFGEIWNNRR